MTHKLGERVRQFPNTTTSKILVQNPHILRPAVEESDLKQGHRRNNHRVLVCSCSEPELNSYSIVASLFQKSFLLISMPVVYVGVGDHTNVVHTGPLSSMSHIKTTCIYVVNEPESKPISSCFDLEFDEIFPGGRE